MASVAVELTRTIKRFGQRAALDGVDFIARSGKITALLGPNGSGKTTLLKLLAGLLRPTNGSVQVMGMDPWRDRAKIMETARFAFAPPALYEQLSARETLTALAGIGPSTGKKNLTRQVNEALEIVGLADRADDRVGVFSFGMRQRFALAQALVPMPRLLVLDEPTEGLDPLAVLELRAILRRLNTENGVTILMSSHLLAEVELLVDELMVLDEGRAIFQGTPSDMIDGSRQLCLVIDDRDGSVPRATASLRDAGIGSVAVDGERIALAAGVLTLRDAARILESADVSLKEFYEERPTLESALLALLRKARGGDDGR